MGTAIGAGELEGEVGGGFQRWQGQEVQASQQGPLHLKDVPVLGPRGPERPAHP